jgi:hypothetical protein
MEPISDKFFCTAVEDYRGDENFAVLMVAVNATSEN